MAPKFQRLKRPDGVPSKLDVALQFLSGAKDACGVAPAQIALGSACVLLTMIRVRSSYPLDDGLLVHIHSGHHGQQTGSPCQSWTVLCQSV